MILLKHFDTTKQTLFGIGKILVSRTDNVGDLVPIINEKMKWAPGKPLKLYEVTNGAFSSTRRTNLLSFSRKSNLA